MFMLVKEITDTRLLLVAAAVIGGNIYPVSDGQLRVRSANHQNEHSKKGSCWYLILQNVMKWILLICAGWIWNILEISDGQCN